MSPVVEYERLQHLFGGATPAEVCARLQSAGVEYLVGKRGRPFTTLTALDKAMGLVDRTPEQRQAATVEIG